MTLKGVGTMFCESCGGNCVKIVEDGFIRQQCSSCNKVYYKNPYPCVSVIIVNPEGEILLGKRKEGTFRQGLWCLPCGYIEYNETYVDAAIREVKEEAGIDVVPDGIINVVYNELSNGVNSIVVVLVAYYQGSEEACPGDDISEIKWVSISEKFTDLAFKSDDYIISKYISEFMNNTSKLLDLYGASFKD